MYVSCNLVVFQFYSQFLVLFISKNPVRKWLDFICKTFVLGKFQVAQTACDKSKKSCSPVADAVEYALLCS